jgi:hypothetical protein
MARKAGREFVSGDPSDTDVFIHWTDVYGTPPLKTTWARIKQLLATVFATTTYVDAQIDATETYVNNAIAAIPNPIESIIIPVSNQTSALTSGTGKFTFRLPYAFTLTTRPRASLKTAQASGSLVTVDIKVSGSTILSTLLTIDNNEKTSTTAATPAVLSTTSLADDAEVVVDVPQIGNGTAFGLVVTLIGRKT